MFTHPVRRFSDLLPARHGCIATAAVPDRRSCIGSWSTRFRTRLVVLPRMLRFVTGAQGIYYRRLEPDGVFSTLVTKVYPTGTQSQVILPTVRTWHGLQSRRLSRCHSKAA